MPFSPGVSSDKFTPLFSKNDYCRQTEKKSTEVRPRTYFPNRDLLDNSKTAEGLKKSLLAATRTYFANKLEGLASKAEISRN